MHHNSPTDASEQDRSNPRRLCSAPRPTAAVTFPSSMASLSLFYLQSFHVFVDPDFQDRVSNQTEQRDPSGSSRTLPISDASPKKGLLYFDLMSNECHCHTHVCWTF